MHMYIQAQIQTVISVILHSRTNVLFEFELHNIKTNGKMYANRQYNFFLI